MKVCETSSILLNHGIKKINLHVAVPFDEDDKDKSVWFLDHDYLENMYGMFKKVNGKNSLMISAELLQNLFRVKIFIHSI